MIPNQTQKELVGTEYWKTKIGRERMKEKKMQKKGEIKTKRGKKDQRKEKMRRRNGRGREEKRKKKKEEKENWAGKKKKKKKEKRRGYNAGEGNVGELCRKLHAVVVYAVWEE
jgi:hypothetical protein